MIVVQKNGILIPRINNMIFCSTYVFNSVVKINKKVGRTSQPTPAHILTNFSDFRSLKVTALIFYKKAFISAWYRLLITVDSNRHCLSHRYSRTFSLYKHWQCWGNVLEKAAYVTAKSKGAKDGNKTEEIIFLGKAETSFVTFSSPTQCSQLSFPRPCISPNSLSPQISFSTVMD